MRPILRKLRGALGTALTWAVVWALGGFALAAFLYVRAPEAGYGPFWDFAGGAARGLGLWGLASGAVFSGVLATIHRRTALGELKLAKVGLWGGFAGFLGTFAIGITLGISSLEEVGLTAAAALVWGAVGMVTAVGTVQLAQRGATAVGDMHGHRIVVTYALIGVALALVVMELSDSDVDPTEADYWTASGCANGDSGLCPWLKVPEGSFERWRDSTEWATGEEGDYQAWIDCCSGTDTRSKRPD